MTSRYNLCDEKWILVRNGSNVSAVSIKEALINAHLYQEMAGETDGQNIALMRMLLAILHTVFSQTNAEGNKNLIQNKDDAFERWKSIWVNGKFPEKPIEDYLNKWYDRFYLIHPEYPFYQVASLDRGTSYSAAKLNGEISESENKARLFSKYAGSAKTTLSMAQAARWLPYLISFDDTSSKPTKEGKANGQLPSPGAGWLGKLGLVVIKGCNLFETLMFNLVMINGEHIENNEHPVWEKDSVSDGERTEIPVPDNLAELYTIQSRRVLLFIDNDNVTGYKLIGGDFFLKENAFIEPMTIWKPPKNNKESYLPKRHNAAKQLWREFSTFYSENDNLTPGVIQWYKRYVCKVLPRNALMITHISSVCYGDKDFFVNDEFFDSLSFNSSILLRETGKAWRERINKQIENADLVAKELYKFGNNINIACGEDKENKEKGVNLQQQFYYRIDIPFRQWIGSIDPENDNETEKLDELEKKVIAIVNKIADEVIKTCNPSAFTGRMVVSGDGSVKTLYSAPKAVNNLMQNVYAIYEQGDER